MGPDDVGRQFQGFDRRSIGAAKAQAQLNGSGGDTDQACSLEVSPDQMVIQPVGKKRPPAHLNITARQQNQISVVEKCELRFSEGGGNHFAVADARSFHRGHEERIEVRLVAIRCADIDSFQPVSRGGFHYSLEQELAVLAQKKKLAVGKQKDRFQ